MMRDYEELVKRLRAHNGWALNKTLEEAADAIEELCKQVASCSKSAASCSKWIGVEEQPPKFGVPVILARPQPGGKYKIEQGYRDTGGWWKIYGSLVKRVSHWQPLPKPPKEDATDA